MITPLKDRIAWVWLALHKRWHSLRLTRVWSCRIVWNLKLAHKDPANKQRRRLPPSKAVKVRHCPHAMKRRCEEQKLKGPDWFLCECWLRVVSICVNQLKQWLPVSHSLKPGANHWYLSCKMAHIPRVTVPLLPDERGHALFTRSWFSESWVRLSRIFFYSQKPQCSVGLTVPQTLHRCSVWISLCVLSGSGLTQLCLLSRSRVKVALLLQTKV